MPTVLMLGNHTDAELREFVRVIRAELLRRQRERAGAKYTRNARPCFRCGALPTEPHRSAECLAELAEAR